MKYNTETCSVELTALELCTTSLKWGDLDESTPATEINVYAKDLYYKIQEDAGTYYNPDVELCNTLLLDGIYCTVALKADGVLRGANGFIVDKIKCVRGRGFYSPPDELTLGMLKCAAYFICVRDRLDTVEGRVTYYNLDTKKLKYFRYRFLSSELKNFYLGMLDRIKYRIELVAKRATEELVAAENTVFPYTELREGQETMIRECYSTIRRGERLFVEAPTGTGKTISALFPAVRALGKGYCDKIFYLTPKTSTRREAFAAAAKLNGNGCLQRTVMLTSKEQMCRSAAKRFGSAHSCSEVGCEYSKGYYDRVDGALREMLQNYRGYSRGLILDIAKKHRVCPYALSLDLSELCDIIICDYNYAFDPSVYLRRYFGARGDLRQEKYVFLVDEAHNLTDRSREMYSAELLLSSFERIFTEIKSNDICGEEIHSLISPVTSVFKGLKKLCKDDLQKDENGNERGFYISSAPVEKVTQALCAFCKKCGEWVKKNRGHVLTDALISLMSSSRKYITVSEYFDRNFRFYAQISDGDIKVRIYCLDPSEIMDSLLTRASASVMFSATLTPPEYFCDMLGGGKTARRLSLASPFAPENLCVAVADYVNTRFDSREDNAKIFATVIAATVTSKAGNYIAYFPSYQCLEQTHKAFVKKYPRVKTVVQSKNMSYSQREEFLSAFEEDTEHLRVGFCVLGGAFSEGVDLPGSRLIGSVIFGVGLPGLSNEKNIIKEHFDLKADEGKGYDYAYTYPGMNNVLQAAGRVIRREGDRGVVVLADDRYASPKYRELFPSHWQGIKYAGNASSLAEIIRRFWENQP